MVTGGAGFLGSHVCARLRRDGDRVLCLDDLSSGRREHLLRFDGDDDFSFLARDVREPLVDLPDVDRIYHLACPGAWSAWQQDPIGTLRTCFLGTLHALELAARSGARLLLASTAEVYGDPEVHPQPEAYRGAVDPLGPRACYDEGKRVAETLCATFRRCHGVDARVARIFNTYGPRMAAEGVIDAFVRRCLDDRALTVFGEGEQTRTFCFVDDMVEGLIRLMAHPEDPGPINLGHPEEITIVELAHAVKRATASSSIVERAPARTDDPSRRCPEVSRARDRLGWSPRVGLDEGLRRTVEAYRTDAPGREG
ncbi:MAG: NAD-dependent epimerase/dehydratase family protein [Myxococcota bacterium]